MVNRYPGQCSACKKDVAPGEGEVRREAGGWVAYCRDHVPAQARSVRRLARDGRVITPYEPESRDTIRAMPGARWEKDSKCWRVSLDIGDRARLLELADRIGLEVAPELRQVAPSAQAERARRDGL